jgi:hypothetical protein
MTMLEDERRLLLVRAQEGKQQDAFYGVSAAVAETSM